MTEYTVNRRYCSTCKKLVSPPVPGVLPKEVFGLGLMLLIVSMKLLGLSYEKISGHFQLLFKLNITDAAINHVVMCMEPRRRQPPEVLGTLLEGDRRYRQVQEPGKGVLRVWQKAQEDTGRRHKVGQKVK